MALLQQHFDTQTEDYADGVTTAIDQYSALIEEQELDHEAAPRWLLLALAALDQGGASMALQKEVACKFIEEQEDAEPCV